MRATGTLHLFLLALPVLTSVRFTPEGHSCCQFVVVEDAAGEYIDLNGDYTLKMDSSDLPDPICLDGCIYTKQGGPPEDEYCFREEATAGANVEQNSCPALSSTLTGTTPITGTSAGTTAASLESIRALVDEARAKVSEHKNKLDSLILSSSSSLSPSAVQKLNQISSNLESMGSSMASIGSLGSGRLRRATSLDSLLLEMKDFYGQPKTTYESIIYNLGSSISGVCPDITTITTTESSTAATSTIPEETMMSTEPTTTIAPITSTASSTSKAPPTTTMAPTTAPTTTNAPTTSEAPKSSD